MCALCSAPSGPVGWTVWKRWASAAHFAFKAAGRTTRSRVQGENVRASLSLHRRPWYRAHPYPPPLPSPPQPPPNTRTHTHTHKYTYTHRDNDWMEQWCSNKANLKRWTRRDDSRLLMETSDSCHPHTVLVPQKAAVTEIHPRSRFRTCQAR